jgi:hypothetical protein
MRLSLIIITFEQCRVGIAAASAAALIRFRVGYYPLRLATDRNEGDGSANAQVKHWGHGALLATCGPAGSVVRQGQLRACSTFFWNARFMRQSGSRGVRRLASRLPLQGEHFLQGGDAGNDDVGSHWVEN